MIARLRSGDGLHVLLVATLLVIAEVEAFTRDYEWHRWVVVLVAGGAVLALLGRRRVPLVASTLAVAASLAIITFARDNDGQLSVVLTVVAASYAVGAHADRGSIAWVIAAVLVLVVGSAIMEPSDVVFPALFFVFLPWLGGRLLRSHRSLTRRLAQETVRAEDARASERERAIARERARIARELHDVLAHNLSAIVVQAGAARRVLERDPDAAAQAARLIADTGREALAELRYLSGAVHRAEIDPLDGPPTLARLGELVERAREAGLDTALRVEGEPVALPAGVELAGYRIVQEALTNALKHAGPARAGVTVRYDEREVVLEIIDDGAGMHADPALQRAGGGHGIVGMRERVSLYGGSVQAGPAPDGGFAVRARLPIPQPAVTV
jgi:signal transduction histidine kinase